MCIFRISAHWKIFYKRGKVRSLVIANYSDVSRSTSIQFIFLRGSLFISLSATSVKFKFNPNRQRNAANLVVLISQYHSEWEGGNLHKKGNSRGKKERQKRKKKKGNKVKASRTCKQESRFWNTPLGAKLLLKGFLLQNAVTLYFRRHTGISKKISLKPGNIVRPFFP